MRTIFLLPIAMALAASAPGAAQGPAGAPSGPQPQGSMRPWRPAAAPIFISPMGEPFREGTPAAGLERWFARADSDHDGQINLAEMKADAARFFALLDADRDGEIAPAEVNRYEREIAPEIQLGVGRMGPGERRMRRAWHPERRNGPTGGGGGGSARSDEDADVPGLEGAGLYGLLNIPEPVMDADSDLNRGVSAEEYQAAAGRRFLLLDTGHDGRLGLDELKTQIPKPLPMRKRHRNRGWGVTPVVTQPGR